MPNLAGLYTNQKIYTDQPAHDNTYAVGTILKAKENPDLSLIIMSYIKRIYYCAVLGDPGRKQKVYFERELLAPLPNEASIFNQVTQRWNGVHSTDIYLRLK